MSASFEPDHHVRHDRAAAGVEQFSIALSPLGSMDLVQAAQVVTVQPLEVAVLLAYPLDELRLQPARMLGLRHLPPRFPIFVENDATTLAESCSVRGLHCSEASVAHVVVAWTDLYP